MFLQTICYSLIFRCPKDSSRSPQLGAASLGVRHPRIREQSGSTDSRRSLRPVDVQDIERLHEQDAEDGVQRAAIRDRRLLREARQRDH